MFAISTSWNYSAHCDIEKMLLDIKELGFNAIELGYNLAPERLNALAELVTALDIKVVSIHNFCPAPAKKISGRLAPCDYYRLSSLDERERGKAVDYTKKSLDTARRFLAKALVIHAGTVELDGDYVQTILELYRQGKAGSPEFAQLKEELLGVREIKKQPYLDATIRSLEEIIAYVDGADVKIGLEVRYYPNEIPNFDEIDYLLKLFGSKGLVYWHDTGHGEVNERLGITPHISYLSRFVKHMLGMHIHDIRGIKDHLAPFSAEFDFSKITPYMQGNKILVIEAHGPARPAEIKEGVERLCRFLREEYSDAGKKL